MKVLLNWLRDFVPFDSSASEIAVLLSRLGFEISLVQAFGGKLQGVVIARVEEVQKHPNADRLSVCKVSDGAQVYNIVCGAPNVRAGITVALARVGAVLPDGTILRAAKLRGVESQGMICSAEELGLEEKSDGILILDDATPVGADARKVLGLDDALIDIEVTPNRRDALSVLGVAREVAAGLGLPLKMPEPRARELDLPQAVQVFNEAPDLCGRYIVRSIRDVKVGPSPEWMVRRLTRCGIRAINNLVDITNYVMLELGQPMHAFDASKLSGRQLRVRRAQTGETLLALDGKAVTLRETMLVIADEKVPVALAGIIGGQNSAISETTTAIALESAAFTPGPIRLTRKALGIFTESSYRFERGTDWEMVALASRRAAQLVQELAGGVACKPIERASFPPSSTTIKLRTERMRQFLGADIKEAPAADMLRRLGCVINAGTGQLAVTVPSWRLDMSNESDVMEEVARLYGYDNIPTRTPAIRRTTVPDDRVWPFERRLASLLTGFALSEATNYSFLSETYAGPFTPGFGQPTDARAVRIANPLSIEQTMLRTSLLPSLLLNVATNFRHSAVGAQLFELSRVFFEDHTGRSEWRRLGIVMSGELHTPHWKTKTRQADFFDLAGVLQGLLQTLHIHKTELTRYNLPPFHPQKSCILMAGTRVLGWLGEVHPAILQQFDLSEPVIAAELDVPSLQEATPGDRTYQPISPFPSIRRDLSFVVPVRTSYDQVVRASRAAAGPMLESISPIDVFESEKIGLDKKSMTITLIFRNAERTLTDSEMEQVTKKIIEGLEKKCEAVLRA